VKKLSILLADDSDELRAGLVAYLSQTESLCVTAEASTGRETLAAVEAANPDVLIMDLVMPELDGFDVLRRLQTRSGKKPYVIALSQMRTDACVSKAMREGADYYMFKPLSFPSLHEHLLYLTREAPYSAQDDEQPAMGEVMMSRTGLYAKSRNRLDERLANIFISVGIPAHIKGYQFLREAIKLAVKTPEIINGITKRLYPAIAENFSTSPSKVERAIRHAIEVAWTRGKIENINGLFGMRVYGNNDKPTNGEFIALLADKMLIDGAGA
jgi:two-component system response regulator (stage 0 sporulation protein A)